MTIMDGGGGGSTGYTKPTSSYMQDLYMADYMITLTRDRHNPERYVKIIKNKQTGKTGRADPQTTIDVCCNMIAMSIFGDTSLKLFRVELEKVIKKAITNKIGDAHDPFRRKSTGDGT